MGPKLDMYSQPLRRTISREEYEELDDDLECDLCFEGTNKRNLYAVKTTESGGEHDDWVCAECTYEYV